MHNENQTHSIFLHASLSLLFFARKVSTTVMTSVFDGVKKETFWQIADELISNQIMICLIASIYMPMGYRRIEVGNTNPFFSRIHRVLCNCILHSHTIHLCTNGFSSVQLYDFRLIFNWIFVLKFRTIFLFALSIFSSLSSLWFVTISNFQQKKIHILSFVWGSSKNNNSNRIFHGKLSHRL